MRTLRQTRLRVQRLAFELVSEILRARVDGSDMASFDGVVFGSFVAQVYIK